MRAHKDSMVQHITNILIAEAIPSLNKGEAIILKGFIQSIKVLGEVNISLLSYYPDIDRQRYPDVEIISAPDNFSIPEKFPERNRWLRLFLSAYVCSRHIFFGLVWKIFGQSAALKVMKRPIWKVYSESDVIILGHDSLLQNPFGDALHFLYIYVAWLAKILGKLAVIYAGTIGFSCDSTDLAYHPLSKFIRLFWRYYDLITVRDAASGKNIKSMGVAETKAHITADVAFLASSVDVEEALKILRTAGVKRRNGPLVGLTLTSSITKHAAPELREDWRNRYLSGTRLIADFIDILGEDLDATFVFLPHCIEPGYRDDRKVARDVYARVKASDRVTLIENEYTPEELKGMIGCCDLFLGERTHSVIGAITVGVPSINLSHTGDQRAFSLLAEILGDRVLFIEQTTAKILVHKVKQLWDERELIKQETRKKLEPVIERAYLNGILLKALLGVK